MPEKLTKRPQSYTSKVSQTDWDLLENLSGDELDDSDIPEPTPEEFARAVLRQGLKPVEPKKQVTLRLDADVLSWFRAQGKGYQTRINSLLRAYMEAHR